jgi:DNA-3-methyladenine glycosylase I
MDEPHRCPWCSKTDLLRAYHDAEWGVPLHDARALFELLLLEGAQAGLSWEIILAKRPRYRSAFDGFDPDAMARYDSVRVQALLQNPGIVRNRLKVEAAVGNARAYLALQAAGIDFSAWLWSFVEGRPRQNRWREGRQIPVSTLISDALSKELKRRGFRFVGSTTMYAFMQAAGMVNDHLVGCFRHSEVGAGASG